MSHRDTKAGELPEYAEEVVAVVFKIPPGQVMTYKEVALEIGWGSARNVGAAMSRYGSGLPWWRVVRSNGTMAEKLLSRAVPMWQEEGIPHTPTGVDLKAARAELSDFKTE